MFSTKSPGEDSGGNLVQFIQFSPYLKRTGNVLWQPGDGGELLCALLAPDSYREAELY